MVCLIYDDDIKVFLNPAVKATYESLHWANLESVVFLLFCIGRNLRMCKVVFDAERVVNLVNKLFAVRKNQDSWIRNSR